MNADGLVYVLNLAGQALAEAQQQNVELSRQVEQLQAALDALSEVKPEPGCQYAES